MMMRAGAARVRVRVRAHGLRVVLVVVAVMVVSIVLLERSCGVDASAQRVRLRDVEILTFTKGERTTARRVSPIEQMLCTSACEYAPTTMMCRNVGWNGQSVQWHCQADLPRGVRLTSVRVSCEGYDNSQDEYVLAGSCGVTYGLSGSASSGSNNGGEAEPQRDWFPWFMLIVFGSLFVWIWTRGDPARPPQYEHHQAQPPPPYTDASSAPPPPPYPGSGGGGGGGGGGSFRGGGGGGGDGWGGMRTRRGTFGSQTYEQPRYYTQSGGAAAPPPPQQNNGAGFWTGLGIGAVTSWLLSQGQQQQHHQQHMYPRYTARAAPAASASSASSWFSWDDPNDRWAQMRSASTTPSYSSSTSRSYSPPRSSSTWSSSAYGGTNMR